MGEGREGETTKMTVTMSSRRKVVRESEKKEEKKLVRDLDVFLVFSIIIGTLLVAAGAWTLLIAATGAGVDVLRRATGAVDGSNPEASSSSTTPNQTALQSIYETDLVQDGMHLTENFRCFMASRIVTADSEDWMRRRRSRKGKTQSKKRKEEDGQRVEKP